jgi:hypothetical protein
MNYDDLGIAAVNAILAGSAAIILAACQIHDAIK